MPWPKTKRVAVHAPNPSGQSPVHGANDYQLQPVPMKVSFAAVDAGGLDALLARQLRDIAHSDQAADLIVATIASLCRALIPSIGKIGVGAMFGRSVRLAAIGQEPWMRCLQDRGPNTSDFAALKSLLESRDIQETRHAGKSILRSFSDLLEGIVGVSLSDELLRQVSTSCDEAAG